MVKSQNHLWLRLYYPGGQTQPEMQGVLGGQVRFNIRLRQVGAQATPPLCSVQLWYTLPSGHSPTSTLSGSTMYRHTVRKINGQNTLKINCEVSHEKQATTADVKLLITRPETELCCQHEGGGYLFPLAHTPSSHFCRGWWGRQEERGRGIGRSVLLSITWFLDLLHVSFDNHSNFYCFL